MHPRPPAHDVRFARRTETALPGGHRDVLPRRRCSAAQPTLRTSLIISNKVALSKRLCTYSNAAGSRSAHPIVPPEPDVAGNSPAAQAPETIGKSWR